MTWLTRLRDAAMKATKGPWLLFSKNRTFEIQYSVKKPIIHWTGFDASATSISKQRANAAYIALCSPERILALADCETALRKLQSMWRSDAWITDQEKMRMMVDGALSALDALE